jgi:hypothetical protein
MYREPRTGHGVQNPTVRHACPPEADVDPSPQVQDKRRSRRAAVVAFLKTVPGLLTALATTLTAIAGILAGLTQLGVIEVRSPIVLGPTATTVAATTLTTAGQLGALAGPTSSSEGDALLTGSGADGVITAYLVDFEATQSDHFASTEPADLNGKPYVHNLLFYGCCSASADYDLGRHYRRLEAMVGVTDEAPSDARSTIEVFLDGRKAYATTVALGKPRRLTLDVTGVLRLHLVMTGNQKSFQVAWGDARLLGVPGEVPATTSG